MLVFWLSTPSLCLSASILQLWNETVWFRPLFCEASSSKGTFSPPSFHSIMYFLCGQRGLISITLRQNGINSPSTSLQGHSWRLSFSQSHETSGGLCETSLIIVHTLVFRCAPRHPFYLSLFPNSFPAENEFLSSHSEHRDYRKLQALKSITE